MSLNDDFRELTGNLPFPWQTTLYQRFISDRPNSIPASCNIPTGLGKTSVVAVWLIALATRPESMPRRLVYVVNRRTVVDQTTEEVTNYRLRMSEVDKLKPLQEKIGRLAISTLRGQFADNREWSADPSRPAVIVGTVDMIGSRLLFSGYGVGKARPLHAGFLGQDVLLVHDEAHLEPAFQDLLVAIETEQKRCNEIARLRVMELAATSRGSGDVLTLTDRDYANKEVKKRIEAKKTIHLHKSKNHTPADEIAELALKFSDSKRAVLVFVRRVDDVEKIIRKLKTAKCLTEQLTGTIRGKERDELVKKPIFCRFLPKALPGDETVYLVCTSAGEVGVNISADHLVCDLSTFDSMAQRFGRVNRFGNRTDTEIHVVHPKEFDENDDHELRLKRTLNLLKRLKRSGSPKALGKLDASARLAAFAPPPTILPVSDILLDAWTLTSIRDKLPGRPMVEPYLHGISAWEPPETHVAWRQEVWELRPRFKNEEERIDREPKERKLLAKFAADLLEDYPLKPHELLRDNSARIFDRLKKLKAATESPVWIVSNDYSVDVTTLGELREAGQDEIEYKIVLLPPSAGGLEKGLLTSDSPAANDVADEWRDEQGDRRRVRVWDDELVPEGMRLVRTIDTKPDRDESDEDEEAGRRYWHWYELPLGGDSDGSKSNKKPVLLGVHTADVVKHATEFVTNLPLSKELREAVVVAARLHDSGKRRKRFQTLLGNADPNNLWAKSGSKGSRIPEQYRHEFGSLLDAQSEPLFQNLSEEMKDFVLHLIAAHHGRGRPHFQPDEAFDPEPNGKDVAANAAEVPRRFARLQRKYGRWRLAYLESLLRAADYAASANPSAYVEDGS